MKITIAYLYYDLLNLYGESGNIKILKQTLESLGLSPEILYRSIEDTFTFEKYDLVYLGAGTEHNQKIALKHLLKYQEIIQKRIEQGAFFLVTGNSIDLFGKHIFDQEKKKHRGLSIFPYTVKEEKRMIGEAIFHMNGLENAIIGFQNQSSVLKNNNHPLFQVISGPGNYSDSKVEGIHEKNFYGTYLLGPILVRNPHFLAYFLEKFLNHIDPDFILPPLDQSLETKAYETFLNTFYPNKGSES